MNAPEVKPENRRIPNGVEMVFGDGLWLKSYQVAAGELIEQHQHAHDHFTLVAVGTVRLWIDEQDQGEIVGPMPVKVNALAVHKFLAVTDAVLCCIHYLRDGVYPAVVEGV